MSSPPPASPLMTPDLRRRLTQRFDDAQRLATRPLPDFLQIHVALTECLRADPGNILYLDALLANLKRREEAAPKQSWWTRLFGSKQRPKKPPKSAQAPADYSAATENSSPEHKLLIRAPDLLWEEGLKGQTLLKLAEAAGECGFEQAELRYLSAAREAEPNDSEALRRLARTLTRQGRFQEALEHWIALNAILPADNEAAKALDDIQSPAPHFVERALKKNVAGKLPREAQSLMNQARAAIEVMDFPKAEECLTRAQSAAGGDLNILALREDLRLLQSEHQIAIARRRVKSDPHPEMETLLIRLGDEHNRMETEIWNMRAERLPADVHARVEVARRLKRVGNYSGAVQRLAEAHKVEPGNPEVLVAMGECWQHLRQFGKALQFYEQAVERSKTLSPNEEIPKLARYRAGLLCAAMGHRQPARAYFEAVIAVDPEFKDTRQRLDKL